MDNVLMMDAHMHQFAISGTSNAAAIFFDFITAFPSVAHSFIWAVMETAGVAPEFIKALKKIYSHNNTLIKIGGQLFVGPAILVGIKQGCPLSMVIFCMCLEPFLRTLEAIIGEDAIMGAFADDIGLVPRT